MSCVVPIQLSWSDCFVLLNVAEYLNGEDMYSLKSSITDDCTNTLPLDNMFDDRVKQLVYQRLYDFDMKHKNKTLFEMAVYFIKTVNEIYRNYNTDYYWIYDMIGGKEPSLNLIHSTFYNDLGKTEWHRDDHRTFLTSEIFFSGNLFLIINILKFIKINRYSLTNCRYGSSVNQIDKILLRLILSFGKTLKTSLTANKNKSINFNEKYKFDSYHTKFLEFAHFYLDSYIPYIKHQHFLHKLLNREIHNGNIECVKMLRNKCNAAIVINSDPNLLFNGEQKMFETFKNAKYCMTIFALMILNLDFDINLLFCLKACYDLNDNHVINKNELLDMDKLEIITRYFLKPISPSKCNEEKIYDKNEEILKFWQFIKQKHYLLMDRQCLNFVNIQIDLCQ